MSEENAPLDLITAFKARHAVRSFTPNFPVEKMNLVQQIVDETNKIPVLFGSKVEIQIHGPGLGSMGNISNEAGWLLLKYDKETPEDKISHAITDACYLMQNIVMKMTQHRIASVWIAGFYNQKLAEQSTPGFVVPGAVAFGEEADKKHFMGSILSFLGSTIGKRLPLEQLFYSRDLNQPVTEDNAGDKIIICKALQSGPSALNKQTWRFVFEGDEIHLFDSKTSSTSSYDVGIAAANMEMLMKLDGSAHLIVKDPAPEPSPLGGEYVCTCTPTL